MRHPRTHPYRHPRLSNCIAFHIRFVYHFPTDHGIRMDSLSHLSVLRTSRLLHSLILSISSPLQAFLKGIHMIALHSMRQLVLVLLHIQYVPLGGFYLLLFLDQFVLLQDWICNTYFPYWIIFAIINIKF